ncbi:DUF4197 domain-containing protein [Hymenobacter taeanensis]|uniref:DUF4197 domain-containing protein n=1 Tax=Hymenobacter taeanensis TaxID=2735321 RepID=A0A6M6BK31_9BACT|nr:MULTISPECIES: DUF4197 domain-containing protein [Hymenobacter]QJX48437.1 DUF4197 domain-containing protein [Hymenobacter taeanensis]UOQ82069.1 DUF4197 domain-containing protein [Hymenobacter sp. 5414T-23]
MTTFRTFALGLGLALATTQLSHAQTKTTAKKTATATKKTTTAKPAATKTTSKVTTKAPVAAPVVAPLTAEEAASGLREALTQGVARAIDIAGAENGFNDNADIRIPMPPDAQLVATTLRGLRMGALVDNFEVALNHSAEKAAAQAKPIFLGAVQNLSFQDALTLATSRQPDMATQLLRSSAEEQLKSSFQPIIKQSLDQTGATRLYAEMVNRYNKIPLMTPINAELVPYASQQTVNGLFTLIAEEEGRIRSRPGSRSTELLKRVFGR